MSTPEVTPVVPSPSHGWLDVRERGSKALVRLTLFWTTVLGRRFGRLVVRVVAFYYALFAPGARRHASDFLRRATGAASIGFWDAYRQILRFAQCTFDALFLVQGKTKHFRVKTNGHELLAKLRDEKRGAILLGAHLGSFYAMRLQSFREKLPLYAVVFTKNARMINETLEELDPGGNATLIELDAEGSMDSMLRIKELVEGGAIVAMLADRVSAGGKEGRTVTVPFMGADARFPVGPYILASMLRCPVYLTFGLYRDPDLYELYCEPFADPIELPRRTREEALVGYVSRYAERLAHYARMAPDNWFNFYDFWAPAAAPSETTGER